MRPPTAPTPSGSPKPAGSRPGGWLGQDRLGPIPGAARSHPWHHPSPPLRLARVAPLRLPPPRPAGRDVDLVRRALDQGAGSRSALFRQDPPTSASRRGAPSGPAPSRQDRTMGERRAASLLACPPHPLRHPPPTPGRRGGHAGLVRRASDQGAGSRSALYRQDPRSSGSWPGGPSGSRGRWRRPSTAPKPPGSRLGGLAWREPWWPRPCLRELLGSVLRKGRSGARWRSGLAWQHV